MSPNAPSTAGGFTIIELMVSIAIVVLVMGIVLFKYNTLNNVVLVKSQAYELALDIRNAQEAGVSVEVNTTGFANSLYGIKVTKGSANYVLYQNSPSSVVSTYAIDSRFYIKDICINGTTCNQAAANICFQRPDFTAHMSTGNNCMASPGTTSFDIKLASVNDPSVVRTVEVTQTGQIVVK